LNKTRSQKSKLYNFLIVKYIVGQNYLSDKIFVTSSLSSSKTA